MNKIYFQRCAGVIGSGLTRGNHYSLYVLPAAHVHYKLIIMYKLGRVYAHMCIGHKYCILLKCYERTSTIVT